MPINIDDTKNSLLTFLSKQTYFAKFPGKNLVGTLDTLKISLHVWHICLSSYQKTLL